MDIDHLKKSEESWDSPACKSYIWVYVWPFYCIIVIMFTEFNQRTPIHKCVVYSEKSWSSQSQHPSSYMRICVYSTAVSHIIHMKYMEQPENPELISLSCRAFRVLWEPEIELLSEGYLGLNGQKLRLLSELPDCRISFLMQEMCSQDLFHKSQ